MIRKRKVKIWPVVLVTLLVAALLGAAYVAVRVAKIWYDNEYYLEMNILGGERITVSHGTEFVDPGAEAYFWGTLLHPEVREVPVVTEGTVDTSAVGTYELYYSVSVDYRDLFWEQTQTRYMKRTVYVVDENAPVITLNCVEGYYTLPGHAYVEEGYTAYDEYDGDLTDRVTATSDGTTVTYKVTDSSGNTVITSRTIFYDDPIPPEISLLGESEMILTEGETFEDPGCTARDNVDGDISAGIRVTGAVDNRTPGTYTLTYSVSDAWGNETTAQRTVTVEAKATEPACSGSGEQPEGKVIYLTFDDGPGKHTARLLDILEKYDVKATFFVVHTDYMDLLPRMVQEGHTVAMHAYRHNYATVYASDEAYFADMKKIQDEICAYTGLTVKMIRFPGGSSNTVSKNYSSGIMTRLTQQVEALGYRYFDWNVDSRDAGGAQSSWEVYQNVVNPEIEYSIGWYAEHKPEKTSFVVLQHDVWGFSVDAVEDIIQWGLANGYTFAALNMNSPTFELKLNN